MNHIKQVTLPFMHQKTASGEKEEITFVWGVTAASRLVGVRVLPTTARIVDISIANEPQLVHPVPAGILYNQRVPPVSACPPMAKIKVTVLAVEASIEVDVQELQRLDMEKELSEVEGVKDEIVEQAWFST